MKVSDIMTSPVITVSPDTPVRNIAALLFKNHISAVPVLKGGRLVGLVSEGDLLHRHEIGTDRHVPPGSWWARLFSTDRSPGEYIKSHANHARDVMTREVISVTPDTPVAEVANLFEVHGINRVPVLCRGEVVGIVSRSNLIEALALEADTQAQGTRPPGDEAIRGRLLSELERESWWSTAASNVSVIDGTVYFTGLVGAPEERDAARVAAENVPGVQRIVDRRRRIHDVPSMV